MGVAIIKPESDRDLYVLWSSVVDNVTGVGTRQEIVEFWREEYGRSSLDGLDRALARADATGTSDRTFRFGGWDDDDLTVAEPVEGEVGFYRLPRRNLAAYALALVEDEVDREAVLRLVEPEEPE
jgi:hypothetical protein